MTIPPVTLMTRRVAGGRGRRGGFLRSRRVFLLRCGRRGLGGEASRSVRRGDFEKRDGALELLGLRGKFFGGRSHFLGSGGVLLNDLVELLHGFAHLVGAGGLFGAGRGDFLDEL